MGTKLPPYASDPGASIGPATQRPVADLYAGGEEAAPVDHAAEIADAKRQAQRYRLEYMDMGEFRIDQELFRSIPADLMLRYGFVPYRREGHTLVIVVTDPTHLPTIDELAVVLATPIRVMVGTASAIQSILKKSESSQRVLEEATEGFQMQILREEENGEDKLTVERLTSDSSPVIRLVDSTIFTAIQRRASDIHIETQDDAVHVKYRIGGVLQPPMLPIDKRFHSTTGAGCGRLHLHGILRLSRSGNHFCISGRRTVTGTAGYTDPVRQLSARSCGASCHGVAL